MFLFSVTPAKDTIQVQLKVPLKAYKQEQESVAEEDKWNCLLEQNNSFWNEVFCIETACGIIAG